MKRIKYAFVVILLGFISQGSLADKTAESSTTKKSKSQRTGCLPTVDPKTCDYDQSKCKQYENICTHPCFKSTTQAALGADKVKCYMKLWFLETGCQWQLHQAKGHAGNPAKGFGICTLETDPNLRIKRGRHCQGEADKFTLSQQMKCCQAIWKNSRSYFGGKTRSGMGKCS